MEKIMMQENMLKKLEFDKVLYELAAYAQSDMGKQRALTLKPFIVQDKIEKALQLTQEGVNVVNKIGQMPCSQLHDVRMHVKRLQQEAVLNGIELAHIMKVFVSVKDMLDYFEMARREDVRLETLQPIVNRLVYLPDVTRQLKETVAQDGYVLDTASTTLRHIRFNMKKTEQAIKDKLDSLIKQEQSKLTDAIVTMRQDTYVIPVKSEHKNSFGGVVRDQSGSGQTFFIEPEAIVQMNQKLRHYQQEEFQEIQRILWDMTMQLQPHAHTLETNHYVLGELDFIHAKTLYARAIKGEYVTIDGNNEVALYGARHPLIEPNKIVKNDILIGGEYQSIIITGPNTGGKTILLKTLGVLQLMAQSGLYIPVDAGSQVGIFTQIFADIGDEQSIEQNLSTFSSHMTNIVSILEKIDEKSLVLFDEVGAGTDPQEGASLAVAILDYIGSKGSYLVATTHYPELKLYAYNRLKTINASMEFDSDTLAPTYKFLMGIPGRSNAFDISKRLGLPQEIIAQAKGNVHEDSQQLNDMIADLEAMRQQVAKQKEQVARDMAQAKAYKDETEQEKLRFELTKEELLLKAKKEANAVVEQAQKESEGILSDIRQMQLKQGTAVIKEHELIAQKTALEQLKHDESLKQNKVLQKAKRQKDLRVGDPVEVMSYGQRAVLTEKVSETQWVVQMGVLKMKVDQSDLRLIDAVKTDKERYIPTLKRERSAVTSQLDLRGKRYEEAMIELDRYLDAAILAGYAQVTIVHGRGTGAIRDGVVKYLRTHRGVKSFEFAPINMGGNGATIVMFKG